MTVFTYDLETFMVTMVSALIYTSNRATFHLRSLGEIN